MAGFYSRVRVGAHLGRHGFQGRVKRGFQNTPRKETAFLAVGGQPSAKEREHVIGAKVVRLLQRGALNPLRKH